MAEPVPIRPDLPINVSSQAIAFCADVVSDFINEHGADPSGAVLILYDSDKHPTISFTNVCLGDLCWAGAYLQKRSLRDVDDA